MNKNPSPKTRFKKGAPSANPLGAALHDQTKKKLRNITTEMYSNVIQLILSHTADELKYIIDTDEERKKYGIIEMNVIAALLKGMSRGDLTNLELLMSRMIGKIPDVIKVDATNVNLNTPATIDEVRDALKKIKAGM